VTLSGGTWPAWAAGAYIRIGEASSKVAQRVSATVLILDEIVNPGADLDAGLILMRTTKDVRVAQQVPQVINKDSLYKPIVRKVREFKKFSVPAKLQEALPFKSKPKTDKAARADSYEKRRAVIVEPEERKTRAALQMLSTIRKNKVEKRQESNVARQADKQKVKERESHRFEDFHKETKKRKHMEQGKEKLMRAKKAAKRG